MGLQSRKTTRGYCSHCGDDGPIEDGGHDLMTGLFVVTLLTCGTALPFLLLGMLTGDPNRYRCMRCGSKIRRLR